MREFMFPMLRNKYNIVKKLPEYGSFFQVLFYKTSYQISEKKSSIFFIFLYTFIYKAASAEWPQKELEKGGEKKQRHKMTVHSIIQERRM